jgi:hypothetical protein
MSGLSFYTLLQIGHACIDNGISNRQAASKSLFWNILSVGPSAITIPSCKMMVRSHSSNTMSRSWLVNIFVCLKSFSRDMSWRRAK